MSAERWARDSDRIPSMHNNVVSLSTQHETPTDCRTLGREEKNVRPQGVLAAGVERGQIVTDVNVK